MDNIAKHEQEFDGRRLQILQAVENLSNSIPFENMTVKMICEEAGISRQTFYQYFCDKYDIAQWYWDIQANIYLRETGRTLTWYEGNVGMIRSFLIFPSFNNAALDDKSDYNSLLFFGYRQRSSFLHELIEEYRPECIGEQIEFEIDFFVRAESQCIMENALSPHSKSPELLATLIEGCIPQRLHDIVNQILEDNLAKENGVA